MNPSVCCIILTHMHNVGTYNTFQITLQTILPNFLITQTCQRFYLSLCLWFLISSRITVVSVDAFRDEQDLISPSLRPDSV
jgi:hypothetical protein